MTFSIISKWALWQWIQEVELNKPGEKAALDSSEDRRTNPSDFSSAGPSTVLSLLALSRANDINRLVGPYITLKTISQMSDESLFRMPAAAMGYAGKT